MPKMTGIFRARKGQAGDEVAYLPISNAVIQFINVVTGKQQLAVETNAGGAYSFNIPIGKYTVGAYIKGGAPIFNTICAGASWEVYADSPSNSFDEFVINPNDGDVDGALLEQFKRLSELAQQGAISSQQSAEQSLASSKVAIDRMDAAGVLMASIDDQNVTDFKAFPDATQHYTVGRSMANGPNGATPSGYAGMAYVLKRKYGAGLEKVILYEDNTGNYRLERRGGVWGEWSKQADTQMLDNGLWDIPKTVPLGYLFDAPRNGKYYTLQDDPNFLPLTPEGRTASFVNVENYHNADKKYIKLTWSQATGSQRTYEIRKVNGTWQTATFNVRSSDISDLINGTAKDKVASEFALGEAHSKLVGAIRSLGSPVRVFEGSLGTITPTTLSRDIGGCVVAMYFANNSKASTIFISPKKMIHDIAYFSGAFRFEYDPATKTLTPVQYSPGDGLSRVEIVAELITE